MNVRKILQFSIGPVAGAVIGLISVPVVAWYFSVQDVGRLSMLQVSISFALILCGLGLDQAYVREYHESNDKPALLKTALLPGLLVLALVVLLLAVLPFSTSKLLFELESKKLSLLLIFGVVTAFLLRFVNLILRMNERGLAYSLSLLLPKLIYLVTIGLYIAFVFEAITENLLFAYVFSQLIALIVFAWFSRGEWVGALVADVDLKKLQQMVRYGIPLVFSGLAFWGLTAMDKFFIRALSSLAELGVYAVAVSFAGIALIFQAVFSVVWAPTIYKWAAEGVDSQRIVRISEYIVFFLIVLWSIAGFFSFFVAYVLPPQYDAVEYIFVTAMAYPLLYTMSEATSVGIGIQRKTLYTMLVTFLALAVNCILNFLLIPRYGAVGAAVSSALSFLLFFIVRTEVSARVWRGFPRLGMYGLVVLAVMVSILSALPSEIAGKRVLWLLVLLAAAILYRRRIMEIVFFFNAGLGIGVVKDR